MRPKTPVLLLLLLFVSTFIRAQDDASPTDSDNRSLGEVARQTREHHLAAEATGPQSQKQTKILELVGELESNTPEEYGDKVVELLSKRDFAGLDKMAEHARSNKSRFPGGTWKLFMFYEYAAKPVRGEAAGDADWDNHIALLKEWVAHNPQSITAHVALAQAYLSYGWKARGHGYADSVSDQGWQNFEGRSDLALAELKSAAHLPERCPHWFLVMMEVAVAQGWSKAAASGLLQESLSYEPGYYHVYRQFAVYLQGKWYGAPGEAEAFAEWIAKKLDGEEGRFVYFEIASLLNCGCKNTTQMAKLSWPRIKEGYAAMEHSYGTSSVKMNRFAYMTYISGDKVAAKEIFNQIGDKWDQETWRNKQRFDTALYWAMR